MEHSGTPNHPWMPPGQGTAPWLPSPPDPGTGIMSLPSQHKHNPSTGAQLPRCTPSKAALPLSTLPTAFPQLPIKPSSLTTPGAPPLLLTPPTLPVCHNPCSARASHHAHKPCQADAPQSRSLPNTFPLQPLAAGKSLPTPPDRSIPPDPPPHRVKHLWKHHPGAGRVPAHGTPLLLHFSFAQASPGEGYVHGQGVENVPASLILFVFQCETRSVICLKWLIGIFCLFFFFFLFSFLFVKRG